MARPLQPARGTAHGSAKLTEQEAREVYRLAWRSGLSQSEIAERYGVAKATVADIKSKRLWGWLNAEESK